jgi:hypothetical protein
MAVNQSFTILRNIPYAKKFDMRIKMEVFNGNNKRHLQIGKRFIDGALYDAVLMLF